MSALIIRIKKILKQGNKYVFHANRPVIKVGKKKTVHVLFIATMIFAMFFSEFALAYSSPHQPLQAYAYFLNNNSGENVVANALRKLTITEEAHLLLKGSGTYSFEIRDTYGRVIFTNKGYFNRTGYAEVVFKLTPQKFKVGETYFVHVNATDNPFPLFYRYASTKIEFKVHKDYPIIGLGAVKDGNQTVITARILTGAGPLKRKKIYFAYKMYNEKEALKPLGFAFSDEEGRVTFVTDTLNESTLYLIVAEFYGDDLYKPAAVSQPYSPVITPRDYKKHDATLRILNSSSISEGNGNSQVATSNQKQTKMQKSGFGHAIVSGVAKFKADMTVRKRFRKVTASDRIENNAKSHGFEFIEENLASLTLVEFLKRITTDDTPASALINVANILMNLDNVPFVIEQTQELLSKLQVPLIPDIAHSSLTEIRLYRTKTYVVNVKKTIAEKHVETYTVTKKISKKVKYTEKITKKIKVRVQYIYYQKIVRKEIAFIRRPRPHWQIVYIVTYKPIIKWKYVWKTVTYTVTKYKTVWMTVTETKTRTYYTYKTVTDKVKKEKREYFRILLTDGFKVVNEQTGEKMSLQQFFLFIMGFRKDALGLIIRYLEAKIFGPALNMLQHFIDFLININKRFLRTMIEKLFEELKSLIFQGFMIHMVRASRSTEDATGKSDNRATTQDRYVDYLYTPSDGEELYEIEPADRPLNIWDTLHKLHAPLSDDIAESTKLTIELCTLEAQAEYITTGEKSAVVIPVTSEALVYNLNNEENKNPRVGWLDLNHYDHTIAKVSEDSENLEDGWFTGFDWNEKEVKGYEKEMGYIPLGVTRTTYIILSPDTKSVGNKKIVIVYSVDIIGDDVNLVPEPLKEFPDLIREQKSTTRVVGDIKKSFTEEYNYLTKDLIKKENVETYGDLRDAVANKWYPNLEDDIKMAIENSEKSGIKIAKVESGDTKTQFFIVNPDFMWEDSTGREHTPIEISKSYFREETGSENKYYNAKHVLRGLAGESYNGPSGVKDVFIDTATAEKITRPIFERISKIAGENDIPANSILHVISPSLLGEVDGVRVLGESDEFHNNKKSMTIVNPRLANPFAVLYLDYFRAYAEHEYIKTRDSFEHNSDFRVAQVRLFRKGIIDSYRMAVLFEKDPKEVKFNVKYKEGNRVVTAEVSLSFLMEHLTEFSVVSGPSKGRMKSIKIDGKEVPADKIVEGFTHLRIEQDNKKKKVTLTMLDENLEPIKGESGKVVFDFREEIHVTKNRKRAFRHILLSDNNEIKKTQEKGLALWSEGSSMLVHRTLRVCFKEALQENPELETKFPLLLGDAEHLGENPVKSASFLLFLLIVDTKGNEGAYGMSKRYMVTLARHIIKLSELREKLKKVLNDPEMRKKLADDGKLEFAEKVYHEIDETINNFEKNTMVFLEKYLRSVRKGTKNEHKITVAIEIAREYIERLLGGKEGAIKLGKTIAVGTLVGLIFPRVIADTIMTLDFTVIEETLDRDAKAFFTLMSSKEARLAVGLSLSTVTFALLNLDIGRFMKVSTGSESHGSSILGEFFGQLFDVKMIFATFLSGLGMIFKALVGAPFYTTEEMVNEIGKVVHDKLGDVAGAIWDSTAGYKMPGLDMTGFEVALTILLQGNGGVIQLITTVMTKIVESLLSEIIKPLVEPLVAEYTYYLATAVLA